MDFQYADYFGTQPSTGYERLLYDCMLGDATLFTHRDGVEATWALFTPLLEAWAKQGAEGLEFYKSGSWGPEGADNLLAQDGRCWRKQ